MGEIMNSPQGVKSGVPERVSIFCPHVVTVTTPYMSQLVNKPLNICDTEVQIRVNIDPGLYDEE